MREEYFSTINIENVSLPGGSPLTGLEIIGRASKRKPHIIAIEINILSRGIDDALVRRYENARPVDALRPLRALAASFQLKPAPRHKLNDAERIALLQSAPAPIIPAYQKLAEEAIPEYNKLSYDAVIRRDAATLKTLVDKLQAEGVKVFLFEMPVSPDVARTRYFETMRHEISLLFNSNDILRLDCKPTDLHFPDGQHADERSSLIVSAALERALATKIAYVAGSRSTQ
jgi:hypothetical protein